MMKTLTTLLLVLATQTSALAQTPKSVNVSFPDKILGIIPQDCEVRASITQINATQYRVTRVVQACGDTLLWGLRDSYSKSRLCRKALAKAGVEGSIHYVSGTAVSGDWETYSQKPSIGELTCETDSLTSDNCTLDIGDLYRQEVSGKVALQKNLEEKGYQIVNQAEEKADFTLHVNSGYVDKIGGVKQWLDFRMVGQDLSINHKIIVHDLPIVYSIEEGLKSPNFANHVPYCIKKEK